MDLLEYQGKELFSRNGMAVPSGRYAASVEEAVEAARELGFPVAVKAQVLIGGRGKAGGIKVAADEGEARAHAEAILGMDITGPHGEGPFRVEELWIETGTEIEAEFYASVILDRSAKKQLVMLSRMGGMDIEEVAANSPEALVRHHVDPLEGLTEAESARIVADAGIPEEYAEATAQTLRVLVELAKAEDATLVEINPLAAIGNGEVVALDSKVTIDPNSLFRHPGLEELARAAEGDPQETMARDRGLAYVKIGGDIGILANGAGLCMSTLDVVAQAGGSPANFLDAAGGSKADKITAALEVLTSDPNVKAILFNIFGGITRCDEVAKGILPATENTGLEMPLVVRLDGTNRDEGLALLADAGLPNLHIQGTMLGAAERAVQLAAEET